MAGRTALHFTHGAWGRYGHVPLPERKARRNKEMRCCSKAWDATCDQLELVYELVR
jgi:hypothetical protein